LKESDPVINRAVVIMYAQDLNYYRALVLSREDLTTYKVR